jgi:adenylate kinase family enzyme
VKRIAVIGCGGSGKTTLARDLGARLAIEVVHLDGLYYGPDWETTPTEEWEAVQRKLVAEGSWDHGRRLADLPRRARQAVAQRPTPPKHSSSGRV